MNKLALTLMVLSISATLAACKNSKDFNSTVIEPTNATSTVAIYIPDPPSMAEEPDISSLYLQLCDLYYQDKGLELEITDKMELQKYETAKQAYDDAHNDYLKKRELFRNGEISEDELFNEYEEFLNGPCYNFWEIVKEITGLNNYSEIADKITG